MDQADHIAELLLSQTYEFDESSCSDCGWNVLHTNVHPYGETVAIEERQVCEVPGPYHCPAVRRVISALWDRLEQPHLSPAMVAPTSSNVT